jgi:hypothetical protein
MGIYYAEKGANAYPGGGIYDREPFVRKRALGRRGGWERALRRRLATQSPASLPRFRESAADLALGAVMRPPERLVVS